MNGRVLVAEDDPKQSQLIRRYLENAGFAVMTVNNGLAALEQARRVAPDLVVLDVMMPGLDGLDVCRVLRYETDIPIIFVTARSTEDDLLTGLELGADDYLTKPYSPRELTARVRSVLRRSERSGAADHLRRCGDLEVDVKRREVRVAGEPLAVTPREFAILDTLSSEPGRAFSRREILEGAVGFEFDGLERTVDVHIASLRRKIEADPSDPVVIVTVYGHGYRLAEPAL